MQVIVGDDDPAIVELLSLNLSSAGFAVRSVRDGAEAVVLAQRTRPSLLILDWMMPVLSGIDACVQLRMVPTTASIPVIILSARHQEADRLRAFESGADDLMAKPFSIRELVARANAIVRRPATSMSNKLLQSGDIIMDRQSHRVSRAGGPIKLSPVEFRLLRFFLENPWQVYSRDHLLAHVWPHAGEIERRTVDVHIRRLRVALRFPADKNPFRTVRGFGYAFEPPNAPSAG